MWLANVSIRYMIKLITATRECGVHVPYRNVLTRQAAICADRVAFWIKIVTENTSLLVFFTRKNARCKTVFHGYIAHPIHAVFRRHC